MKKLFYFCIMLLIISGASCRARRNYDKFDFENGPNPCINAFKDNVFLAILRESFKSTDAFKEIRKLDVGNPYDGITSLRMNRTIDSIGKAFAKKIPPPMMCPDCIGNKNYYIAQALHFYKSRELDSIARAELKNGFPDCFK